MDDQPNIILAVLDSLRTDRLSCYGGSTVSTPTLDAIAEEGRPLDAFSAASWSIPAHASLFTGRFPSEHSAHAKNKSLEVDSDETLAGVLSSYGYDSVGFSTNPWIPSELGFDTGFDEFYDIVSELPFNGEEVDPRHIEWPDDAFEKYISFIRWCSHLDFPKRIANVFYWRYLMEGWAYLPANPASELHNKLDTWLETEYQSNPCFLFLNYMDPHEPYQIRYDYLPDDISVDASILDFVWCLGSIEDGPDPENHELIREIYDSSVRYTDDQLKHLTDEIIPSLEGDTILIVVSDHGQSLGENGYWGHGTYIYDELISVPCLIRAYGDIELEINTGQEGPISLVDIPRYICTEIGEEFDEHDSHPLGPRKNLQSDGIAILAESYGPHQDTEIPDNAASSSGYTVGMGGGWKLIHNRDEDHINLVESGETTISKQEAESLFRKSLDELSASEVGVDRQVDELDASTQKRLEELGYM